MSDLMKRAHELAPLRRRGPARGGGRGDIPRYGRRDWTQAQRHSHQFAVDIAERLLSGDVDGLGDVLGFVLKDHAEAARDAALEERDG